MKPIKKPKKLTMRQQIEQLTAQLWQSRANERRLQEDLSNAHDDAFKRFTKQSGALERGIHEVSDSMGKMLGEKLLPHAEYILKNRRKSGVPLISFSSGVRQTDCATVLHGSIEPIHFSIVVDR